MRKKLQINTTKSFLKGLFVMVFIFAANISFAQVLPPPPTFPPDVFELQGDSVICPNSQTNVTIFKN